MSQDFRMDPEFTYGLCELNYEDVRSAQKIANPGCFATAILLGLIPLFKNFQIKEEIHISAITGSSGAGQRLSETTHFTWRDSNVSVYKAFEHRHLAEIKHNLSLSGHASIPEIHFLPFRGNFTRGILAATYLKYDDKWQDLSQIYEKYYRQSSFVHLMGRNPDIKMVVNTNNCYLHLQRKENRLLIISVIDNLVKGAAGQAVQNMNLMYGFDEKCGLLLKASAF
jgi:N-acetyl-gamma-glutamyl-phosphate reductase